MISPPHKSPPDCAKWASTARFPPIRWRHPVDANGLRPLDGQARQARLAHRQRRQLHPDGGIHRCGGFGSGKTPRLPHRTSRPFAGRSALHRHLRRIRRRSCRGEKDAVQILFGGSNTDLLDHFYGDGLFSSHWMISIGSARAGSRPPPARRPRTADSRSGCRHRRSRSAIAAAAGARSPHLHLHRRFRRLLLGGEPETRGFPRGGIQGARSRKTLAPIRISSPAVTISSSAPTCFTPWPMSG